MMESSGIRWTCRETLVEEVRKTQVTKFSSQILKGRDNLGILNVDVRIILNLIFQE
jgi:hypothetical protein